MTSQHPTGQARAWAQGPFTGWHMLTIMVLFFGVIIAVNITMAVMAGRSWTGLVVKNSYVASQHFNAQLAEAERQRARGWRSQLGYTAGQVSFELRDKGGRAIVLDDLKIALGRPASEAQDRTLALRHLGDGKYQAAMQLGAGHWAAKITGGTGEYAYRRDARLFVDEPVASRSPVAPDGAPNAAATKARK